MTYNPHKLVLEFSDTHPKAFDLLKVYNEVDPLHVYYGDELNPDEYIGYGKRLLYHLNHETIEEAVKKSFHSSQFNEGWISTSDLEEITQRVKEIWKGE